MDAFVVAPGHTAAPAVDNDRKVRLGMLFYVLTDVTFVIFLLVSYVWLRAYNTNGGWFPFNGMRLPDSSTINLLTGLIVVSAICYFVAYRGILAGNQLVLRIGLALALLLAVVTVIWQIRFMGQQQFATKDGSFASTFILLSGYHVYHLLLGIFLGIGVTVRAFQGRYTADRHLGIITIGYFWYWMALMPVLVTLMMALLPPKL